MADDISNKADIVQPGSLLRLVKATIMLPFTVVVTILRWLFL